MEERVKLEIKLTAIDKAIELAGWFSIVVIWVLAIINYNDLPDIIPTHYNATGKADSFGGKATILTLPLIVTILFAGLTAINKFPHIFNYPANITKENAQRQYTMVTRLIRYLKLVIVIIFGFITYQTIQNAGGKADGLGKCFLPIMLATVFAPLIWFIVKSVKKA